MGQPSYLCRVLFVRAPVLELCFLVSVNEWCRAHIAATAGPEVAGAAATGILSCEKRNRSQLQTHDKNTTTYDHTKDRPLT